MSPDPSPEAAWVVSFHEPLACIESRQLAARRLAGAQVRELPLVTSVGYETPGSFGSWCADLSLPCITADSRRLRRCASERYIDAMTEALTYGN